MEALPSGDIQAKYQKLASEYSKLRVHLKVLKKGVLDEQAKSQELREALKEKEKSLRKGDLEVESLTFRNQQLTRRVSVLQDELDSLQQKLNKKAKGKGDEKGAASSNTSLAFDSGILQEELQKKIIENGEIASQLSDKIFEISQLRYSLEDYQKSLAENECKYKTEIARIKNKNHELHYTLEEMQKERHGGTPSKGLHNIPSGSQATSCNGDFLSEAGSLPLEVHYNPFLKSSTPFYCLWPPASNLLRHFQTVRPSCQWTSDASFASPKIGSEDALSSVDDLHVNEQFSVKVQHLEQDNQKLKMEYELLRMDNESLKLELGKYVASAQKRRSDGHDSGDFNSFLTPSTDGDGRVTGLLGTLEVPFVLSEEIQLREERMKVYFRDKITELKAEKERLDSKCEHYIKECEILRLRFDEMELEKQTDEHTIQEKHKTISKLEEELHSTSRNYEEQMSVLTEHVAGLHDQLARQHEEIDVLKQKLSTRRK